MPKKTEPKAEKLPDTPDIPDTPVVEETEASPDNAVQAEIETLKDQYLRLRAEFDNYRKRSQKEREALYVEIRAEAVKQLLPVLDNLERAVASPCQDTAYAKGVEMTLKQCIELVGSMGVTVIEAAGCPFDPNLHDAVMHVEDENAGENTVVEVLRQGYQLGDKVLRHAMVKVAN